LGRECFSGPSDKWGLVITHIGTVIFEADSLLRRIPVSCFQNCRIRSLYISNNTSEIPPTAFSRSVIRIISVEKGNGRFKIVGNVIIACVEFRTIKAQTSAQVFHIYWSMKTLGDGCFRLVSFERVIFESNSSVERFGDLCFSYSSLQSLCIPRSVEVLGKLYFKDGFILRPLIFEVNSRFTCIGDCCFYLCSLQSIHIAQSVEVLGRSCFESAHVQKLTFEDGSQLRRMKEKCFRHCSLRSICIPRNVKVLSKSCFESSQVASISFEAGSLLTTIEAICFAFCHNLTSLTIPDL
jgi:uncharacterized integral membrane protein